VRRQFGGQRCTRHAGAEDDDVACREHGQVLRTSLGMGLPVVVAPSCPGTVATAGPMVKDPGPGPTPPACSAVPHGPA
jgi:hypothetical protein